MQESELRTFLETLHHHLNILREREAKYGGNAPLELLNQIEDHHTAIQLVESRINGDISARELEDALAPLNLSLDRGDTEIVAGKNIVKIGSLVVPAFPLMVALVAVVVVSALLGWYYLVPAKMPLNTFNVAVAEFGKIGAQGKVSASKDGQELSEWMFGELQSEYKSWPTKPPVVWHDSMNFLQKRANIGLVRGSTPVERQQAAQEIAGRLGATMVIYGNIAVNADPPHIIPEFYIADIENEADEIVGIHQLGQPIEVRLPLDLYDQRASSFFEQNLGVRADALAWFTRGLALDLSGRHQDALAVLQEAENEEQLKSWSDNQGREILYYFIGRQALFLSREDAAYLDEAEAAFKKSLEINPNYTRAHLGLGGVYFQRAQQLSRPERLQSGYPELAVEEYTRVVAEGDNSPGSQIGIKGLLALGKAYRLLGQAYFDVNAYDQAVPAYEQATDSIEQALALLDPGQHRLLAEAFLGLGIAYEQQAYIQSGGDDKTAGKLLFEKAYAAYDNCIKEAEAQFYDTTLQDVKNKFCAPNREEVQKVLADL
ncbi:MAG: hypothetical protein JXM69_05790 [Anaerolineae bacterium]|nr:hypothetical protein [Anaerolineae bacterium]